VSWQIHHASHKKRILPVVFVFVLRGVSNPQNAAQFFLRLENFDYGGKKEDEVQKEQDQKRTVKVDKGA
jgi:hypothetical protein